MAADLWWRGAGSRNDEIYVLDANAAWISLKAGPGALRVERLLQRRSTGKVFC